MLQATGTWDQQLTTVAGSTSRVFRALDSWNRIHGGHDGALKALGFPAWVLWDPDTLLCSAPTSREELCYWSHPLVPVTFPGKVL